MAWGAERAKNSRAGALIATAWQLRWRAPELSRMLSERAAEFAVADGDEHTRLRAETLTLFALNRLGQGVVVAERAVASLRAAEAMDEPELAWRLRVELANAARVVGAPLTGFAALRPVLEASEAPKALRAAAMVQLVDCLAHLGSVPELAEALAEADQLYGEDPDLEPDVVLVLRGLLHSVASAHHRRWGDLPAAAHAAREGLALLDQLSDPAADSGHARGRLVLQLVCALLDSNRPGEARAVADHLLTEPVRAPVASSAGWIRLALATRLYLPSGQPEAAARLLGATADSAQRHGLEPLLAESLTALSQVHEMGGEYAEALSCLRTAYAAERRRQRAVHAVRLALLEQIPVPQTHGESAAGLREQVTAMLRRGRVRRDTPRGAAPMLRRTAAEIDDLTGLLNQSGFRRRLDAVVNGGDPGHALTLVLFDVGRLDGAAPVHVSEQLLRTVADRVRDTAPTQAAVARVGGEELAVLLPGATEDQAQRWAEQLRTEVAGLSPALPVTVNTGVAQHRPGTRADVLITEADRALARAKNATTPPRFRAADIPARPSRHATPTTEPSTSHRADPPAAPARRATSHATGEFAIPRTSATGDSPAPAVPRSGSTGEFAPPARPDATGEFAIPAPPRATSTGQFAVPAPAHPGATAPTSRASSTGEFAAPAHTGEFPAATAPRAGSTGEFPLPTAPRSGDTGEFPSPAAHRSSEPPPPPAPYPGSSGEFPLPVLPRSAATGEFSALPAPQSGEFGIPAAPRSSEFPAPPATSTGEFPIPAEPTGTHARPEPPAPSGRRAAPDPDAGFAAPPSTEPARPEPAQPGPAPLGGSEPPLFFEAPTAPQPIITDETPRPPELDAPSLTGPRPEQAEPAAPAVGFSSMRAATVGYDDEPVMAEPTLESAPEPARESVAEPVTEPEPPAEPEPEPAPVAEPQATEEAPAPEPRSRRRPSLAEALDFDWSQALREAEEPALPPPPRAAEPAEARHPDLAPREAGEHEVVSREPAHPDLAPRESGRAASSHPDLAADEPVRADLAPPAPEPPAWPDTPAAEQSERRSRGDAKLAELLAEALAAYETGRREDPESDFTDPAPAAGPAQEPPVPTPAPQHFAEPEPEPARAADPPAEPLRYPADAAEPLRYPADAAEPQRYPSNPADYDPAPPAATAYPPRNPAVPRNEITYHRAQPRTAEASGFHQPIAPSPEDDEGPFTGRCGPEITGAPDPFAGPDADPFGYARAMDATANASMLPEPPQYPEVEDPTEPQPRVVDVPREQAWTPPDRDPSFG